MTVFSFYSVLYKFFNEHPVLVEGCNRIKRYVRNRHRIFIGMIVVVFFVFAPCLLKPTSCFADEVIFKIPHGYFMRSILPSEKFMDRHIPLINTQKSIIKGPTEFFGSSIKRDYFMKFQLFRFGKEVACNSGYENAKEDIHTFFDDQGNLHLFLDPFLWVGFGLCILYFFLYYFIQLVEIFLAFLQKIYDSWR